MPSLSLPSANGEAEAAESDGFAPNAFIRTEGDGQIVLTMPHVEMGQGTYTSIAMLIAEKLEIDLKQLRLAPSPASRWRRAHLPVFGLMGEDFLRILRVNELLGEINAAFKFASVELIARALTSLALDCSA
jgi:Molybdopterin-binding domain of aldehyde dehydrogenase